MHSYQERYRIEYRRYDGTWVALPEYWPMTLNQARRTIGDFYTTSGPYRIRMANFTRDAYLSERRARAIVCVGCNEVTADEHRNDNGLCPACAWTPDDGYDLRAYYAQWD